MSILTILSILSWLLPFLEWLWSHNKKPGFVTVGLVKRILRRIRSSDFQLTQEQSEAYGAKIERFKQLASQLGISEV